eukprot:4055794-Ditylum_brightwellii.AAC.1
MLCGRVRKCPVHYDYGAILPAPLHGLVMCPFGLPFSRLFCEIVYCGSHWGGPVAQIKDHFYSIAHCIKAHMEWHLLENTIYKYSCDDICGSGIFEKT